MKRILSLLSIVALTVGIISCEKETNEDIKINVTSVSLSHKEVIIIKGDSCALSVSIKPKDWSLETDVSWLFVSPSEGNAGSHTITITTLNNPTGKVRNGTVSLTPGNKTQSIRICQRPYIYQRKQVASGTITNSVSLYYTGTVWSRVYTVLPVPKSNLYQDIQSVNTYDGTVYDCPDGINRYMVTDLYESDIPPSGNKVIMESIRTVAYEVTANLDWIDSIPPYRAIGDGSVWPVC